MSEPHGPIHDDVEQLLLNARLRDELEPFLDESITRLNGGLPTAVENEYLASMLAWEVAPVLPIAQWFDPELRPPQPDRLTDDELHVALWETIERLYEKKIVLEHTDHLSDRELYCLILRDILPSPEKKIEQLNRYLRWDCAAAADDPAIWLRYYATDNEREAWARQTGRLLPKRETPPYHRRLPEPPA